MSKVVAIIHVATVGWVSKADGHLVRLYWTLPNGTSIWKVSSHDVPFVDAGDLVMAGRLAAQAAHS